MEEGFAIICTELYGYGIEVVTIKDKWRGLIVWLWTALIVLCSVVVLVENRVEKSLDVKRKKISETPGKIVERWGRTIIAVIFLFSYLLALTKESDFLLKWHWFVLLVALLGFQVLLEWKYLKNSKQYISTLIRLLLMISICLSLILLYS